MWYRRGAAAVNDGLESDGGRSRSWAAGGERPYGSEDRVPVEPALLSPVNPTDAEAAFAFGCLHGPVQEVCCTMGFPSTLCVYAFC